MAESNIDSVLAWLAQKGGRVRTVQESLLQNACRELGWRQHGTAAQERLRHVLYEMAARRLVVLEFHTEDPSRIVMICLTEMSDETIQLEALHKQIKDLHGVVTGLRGQLQAAAPDSAAALQLAQEAEDARQLVEDQLAQALRELGDLRATIEEEVRAIRAEHPRAKDQRRIRELTHTLHVLRQAYEDDERELVRLNELADGIPGYQAQIRELTEKLTTFLRMEVHQLMCGCVVGRLNSNACTFQTEGPAHPWFPIVIPGVTDPQEGYALLAHMLAGHALRSGEETMVIMNNAEALGAVDERQRGEKE